MRASIQAKSAATMGTLGVIAFVWCGALRGQQPEMKFKHADVGSTVSVVSLRIPEKAWQHFDKAKELAEHGRLTESDMESGKAIAIAPAFAAAYLLRASAQIQEHNFADAVASIAEARRIEPGALWAGVLLAGAYNGLQRFRDAELVLNALRGPEAQSWQCDYEHARAAIGLMDAAAAMHWSAIAVDAAPESFGDTSLVRANALVLAHRWADAALQLEAYLHTREPQGHRPEVLAALQDVKRRAREEEVQQVALR